MGKYFVDPFKKYHSVLSSGNAPSDKMSNSVESCQGYMTNFTSCVSSSSWTESGVGTLLSTVVPKVGEYVSKISSLVSNLSSIASLAYGSLLSNLTLLMEADKTLDDYLAEMEALSSKDPLSDEESSRLNDLVNTLIPQKEAQCKQLQQTCNGIVGQIKGLDGATSAGGAVGSGALSASSSDSLLSDMNVGKEETEKVPATYQDLLASNNNDIDKINKEIEDINKKLDGVDPKDYNAEQLALLNTKNQLESKKSVYESQANSYNTLINTPTSAPTNSTSDKTSSSNEFKVGNTIFDESNFVELNNKNTQQSFFPKGDYLLANTKYPVLDYMKSIERRELGQFIGNNSTKEPTASKCLYFAQGYASELMTGEEKYNIHDLSMAWVNTQGVVRGLTNPETILKSLNNGVPVVTAMGKLDKDFNDHYSLIVGVSKDAAESGNVTLNDFIYLDTSKGQLMKLGANGARKMNPTANQ